MKQQRDSDRKAGPDHPAGTRMPSAADDSGKRDLPKAPEQRPEQRPEPRPAPRDGRIIRTFALRAYLTAMALAVMVPMGALGAFGIQQVVKEYQSAYQERLRATARLLGIALDSEIEMRKTAIMALANSPLLDGPVLDGPVSPALYNYAKQIGTRLGAWVTIKSADRPLVNTRVPYGAPVPPRIQAWDATTAAQYRVTNLMRAEGLPTPFVSVVGPVFRDGHVIATISIPFGSEQLGRRLAEGLFTSDGVLCVLDGDGVIIARSRKLEQYLGVRAPEWLRAAAAKVEQTVAMGRLADGGEVIVATGHPSEAPGWTVVVAQPIAGYYQEWFRPLMVLAGGGLVLLLALLMLVDRFALWLVRPLKALTQNAKIVARGGRERLPEEHRTSRVAEFETLRVSLNEAAHVMDGRAEAIRVAFASARRERNLLHSVVNGTADPTFVRDSDGRLVLANAAGLAMLGLPAATALGQVHSEPGKSTMDEACRAEDRQVIESGLSMMIERTINPDGDTAGERRTFLGTKSPWRSASGEVLGVVMIIHDITEWKRSEERLREIQGELIRTGRLSAMGAMANGLAHELNQPLAAITNYLGAARRLIAQAPAVPTTANAAGAVPLGVASGAIEDACTQAMRAGEIVSRLREFIGRGVASMRIEAIGDLIDDACALALPQETRSRVKLSITVDPELESVFVDRLQIQQVLVNLVLNAVQSMAGSAHQGLTITASRDAAGDTRIDVADTGAGIPQAMLSAVFEPFVTTRLDGLGMGLAIARMIVAAHGGTLAASNNAEGGATLTLALPAVLSMEDADA
jgi:two-component system sensor kinase FixL